MLPLKPLAFLLAALAAGVLLAVASWRLGLPTGWIGAAALVAWAFLARGRWARLEATSGMAPDAPERILWLRFAGNSLILGHLAAVILLAGDDLRVGRGNTLAYDSWTLVLGQALAALAFRRDRGERDERHEAILARGVRAGYASLIVALVLQLAWLAFTPPSVRSAFSHFVLANLLVAFILASYGVMLLVQLALYARDSREALADEDALP